MDNLTHSLIGIFLARTGFNRIVPNATAILLLAANAPDADVISGLGGAPCLLQWHRNFTHSLPFSPVLALAVVALVKAFSRNNQAWIASFLAAWAGVLSHLVLDLTNNYGVRLLEPFSSRWFEWDTTYVIDPYLWFALLFALLAPLVGGLLGSEIGQKRRTFPSRSWAAVALALALFYDCARAVLHARALAVLDSRLYNGQTPARAAAFPTPLNPLLWQGLVETPDRYLLFLFKLNEAFDPGAAKVFYKNNPGTAVPALQKERAFGALIRFTQYALWRVNSDENNARYALTDLRFGDPVAQTFTCSARLVNATSAADERCDFSFSPNFGTEQGNGGGP